ncbi:MAG TPA: phosphomannomutase/phosphoglucomutase, partial [Thermoanaerobaculia bacterium]|nr:phosphomannomutase/phosphoglucomutase [Thermoanaerobaculia bacterium]
MSGIFKAYDVRGIVPTELNEEIARQIGTAFQFVLDAEDRANGNAVVVSRDMREHSPGIEKALIEGITAGGLDVIEIGLATTPMNYFAIAHLKTAGGVQVTASHNPAEYNGLKFSRHGARPVSGDHGIALMEKKVKAGDLPKAARPGTVTQGNVTEAYDQHVLSFLRGADRRLKVVVDAANGMGTIDKPLLEAMNLELIPLFFELDGRFPNHEA